VWFRLPLVVLATAATVIASQSMISGAFSLARQATQLGLLPRLTVRHTSREGEGQIYMPQINGILLVAVVFLVLEFANSDRLAHAYGIAVTGTFAMTSCLAIVVARRIWGWPRLLAVAVFGFFLVIDLVFFTANIPKVPTGGWFPLLMGVVMFLMMTTWKRGRDLLAERWRQDSLPLSTFVARPPRSAVRVPGTAVFMTGNGDFVPGALLHNLKHNKVLHERILFVTVVSDEVPTIPNRERSELEEMAPGIYRVRIRYGFMESPNVPRALTRLEKQGLKLDPMQTSYFLGREQLVPAFATRMPRWRHRLFVAMARNAVSATEFFRIPADRVVELGVRVAI
jgi:KUP system potassium uptake protein